ncbi:MAG: twin-arginine translocase TatA/TatE family subunit [Beijerinckiaceae bacterium]
MGSLSIWHWLVVAVIVLLLFGRGKISELMGDVAGGIKAFKKGMAEDDDVKKAEEEKKKLEDAAQAAAEAAKSATSSTKTN